ncbi:MAG: carbamoyl-phosphate synthase large subunit [Pseudomonadota bacterium]|nr:carbamoyl-phosphate synthase large subunit [Pseudomonadota bacterium]
MPRREDLNTVLIIGAGPIVIGQACEFDYSGAQACKALREVGYRVVLVNSNPATIMTDPEMADAVYIEPISWQVVERIIDRERPDALLPTMGGQTALNCALDLAREGVLERYGVELIGASRDAIDKAEDRERFRDAMRRIGLETPRAGLAHTMEDALAIQEEVGFPTIIRPSFTMGGTGGGIAYNREEFVEICERGLDLSPTNELLVEESILGWKEFEMEVVRDRADNCIIICSIENFDPMGVHTGDSITVAPAQTLTDKEYQRMRDASIAVLREIGVDTGGSNVQFAVNPRDGRLVVIEMNPRVSRSSALASKATGFPIAKVAAKLAVGFTLDELDNDITGGVTPASFEPTIDYVVTKVPRFDFAKFPQADATLTTQMKSVGEVMAIGRTFQESLQKALRGLEIDRPGLTPLLAPEDVEARLDSGLSVPGADRVWIIGDAFRAGRSVEEIHGSTGIDPWFLAQIEELIALEQDISTASLESVSAPQWRRWKRAGFGDQRLAELLGVSETAVRERRRALDVHPVYKRVDSCAGEFPSATAYMYSTYEQECEAEPDDREKIMILGGGPNRIGQGIEFDYCCVHAALSLRALGYQTIMVNCNPETVSTDYDTSDRLYFEPLTLENVLDIIRVEQPKGIIVQFGGQTPLKLARALEAAGAPIIGTSPDAIDRAEDRERFLELVNQLGLRQPRNAIATHVEQAIERARDVGYPLVVRPSYVLGGRAMEIVHDEEELRTYMTHAVAVTPDAPVLLDRFLNEATEVDVDAVSDGEQVVVGGVMEHIEEAGVHSGDSACCLPPFDLDAALVDEMGRQTVALALELGVVGLMNVQFAIKDDEVYLLEVNPRASRTVPFVSKATSVPLAKVAARCMAGRSLASQGVVAQVVPGYFAVKEAMFPFNKFLGVDTILGPEMKSTGEVMGIGRSFGEAYGKAALAVGQRLPDRGTAFLSVRDADQDERLIRVARGLSDAGFRLTATRGTAGALHSAGLLCDVVNKVKEGRPHVVDLLTNGEIDFVVNTTEGRQAIRDSFAIRRAALRFGVAYTTTLAGAEATCEALAAGPAASHAVRTLQEIHQEVVG